MTQEISSLMDGELASDEAQRAIAGCCGSEDAKVNWHLYHLIGDTMRGQAPRSLALPKDVAEALDCSVEAVKWHVFQARKKLKELLKDHL